MLGIGALYAVGGLVAFIMLTVNVWRAAKMIDTMIQAMLVIATLCGVWFVSIAMQNLGMRPVRRRMPQLVRRSPAH